MTETEGLQTSRNDKIRNMKKIVLTILILFPLLCFIIPFPVYASPARAVREGNKLYHQKKYDGAMEKYNEAKAEAPDSDIVNYDLGTALYKKGRYQEAADAFTKAMNTEDKKLETKAMYNMANSKYKLGSLQENTDISGAINLYRESLDYYKRAMEMDKKDSDAKYNHEFVEKKIKDLQEKLKKQPPQQQQDQRQEKKDKQEGKESQAKSGKEKQGDRQQQKSEDKQAMDEKDRKAATGSDEEKQPRSGAGKKGQEMSPEEARMLLEAYGQEESGDVFNRERKGYSEEMLKDW